jgi:hypothetical protein
VQTSRRSMRWSGLVCERRGHKFRDVKDADETWRPCLWCKSLVREVRNVEYRADEPPEDEMDMVAKMERQERRAARL